MLDEKGSDGKHLTSHPSHDHSPFSLAKGRTGTKITTSGLNTYPVTDSQELGMERKYYLEKQRADQLMGLCLLTWGKLTLYNHKTLCH